MITASRFLGYDKNEYGDLIVNRKEAEIVSLTFDLYMMMLTLDITMTKLYFIM